MANENEAPDVLAKKAAQQDELRKVLADIYTFVRSREVNSHVASFTLDHYIAEAKVAIKGTIALTDASGSTTNAQGKAFGSRLALLDSLNKLEEDFNANFEELKKYAESNG